MVGGFHVIDQRQVEHIEPNHRVGAIVAMLVPQTGGRENQVATAHRAFLAIHRGVRALAFHNHAHRIRGVAMTGCPFTGHEQLHAQVHGGRGLHFFQTMAGVGQHQNTALGFFNRCQFTRFQQQGLQAFVGPMRGLGLTRGNLGWQHTAQAWPQRHQVQVAQILHIVCWQVFQAAQFIGHGVVLQGGWAFKPC